MRRAGATLRTGMSLAWRATPGELPTLGRGRVLCARVSSFKAGGCRGHGAKGLRRVAGCDRFGGCGRPLSERVCVFVGEVAAQACFLAQEGRKNSHTVPTFQPAV